MIPVLHGVFGAGGGAAGGFESIASAVTTAGQATVTFSGIPQTFVSLQIRALVKDAYTTLADTDWLQIKFNGNSANYSWHWIRYYASSLTAGGTPSATDIRAGRVPSSGSGLTDVYGVIVIDIDNYASTTRNTVVRSYGGATSTTAGSYVLTDGSWRVTDAVTSIALSSMFSSQWAADCVFSLYGIKGAA